MKHLWKRGCAAALALALALSLAACGGGVSAFDATKYIKGMLDTNYKGEYTDYMDLVDTTEKECEEIYLGNLEAEANAGLASVFSIDNMTGDVLDAAMELYKDIYALAKYTVDPATKIDEKTYGVKVTVEPIDVFHLVLEELNAEEPASPALNAFLDAYADVDVYSMTDEEYAAYDADWANMIVALTREKLPESGYLDAKSLVVQVAEDSDGMWGVPDDDFYNLDMLIIDYNF